MPSHRSTVKRRRNVLVKLTEFKKYPKLPLELKNMIVKLATPTAPKIVVIGMQATPDGRYTGRAKATYHKPAFLDVDRGSREVVLKMFTAAFTINLDGAPVYFNFKTDALVYESTRAMALFNGNYCGLYTLGPSPNPYPVVMVGYECKDYAILAPDVLERIGKPAYFTFLHKSGRRPRKVHEYMAREMLLDFEEDEKRGREIVKTYKVPTVSYKTPLQMLKLLDEIKKTTTKEEIRRAKEIEATRDIRVFD
ncbi:hypothetical protein DL98DRAFT_589318 [Cadophora sp. DSE1049]|nr:hypothetical protein DL98DRAFT_589318 [Cadophora sp. DSE1049]